MLFTMAFSCTSSHMPFLRSAIRGIGCNIAEVDRNMGGKPFHVLWNAVFPTMFSLTLMPLTTGSCAMSAIVLLTILSSYERKIHYLPVSRIKSKLQKQKINAPASNVKTEP